jgi:hypothetical protein
MERRHCQKLGQLWCKRFNECRELLVHVRNASQLGEISPARAATPSRPAAARALPAMHTDHL